MYWRNLGDSYRQIPYRAEDAKLAYQKAAEAAVIQLKINPSNTEALGGLALYEAHLGDNWNAKRYIVKALALAPKDSDLLFTSALVYEIVGNRDKALGALDQALKAGYSLEEIEKEPELRVLRSDPRYQQWLRHNAIESKSHWEASITNMGVTRQLAASLWSSANVTTIAGVILLRYR